MTYFNTVSLIVSFVGGGIISSLINWIRANKADKKDREIKLLDDQIRKLYGPLYFLVSQSEKLFQLEPFAKLRAIQFMAIYAITNN